MNRSSHDCVKLKLLPVFMVGIPAKSRLLRIYPQPFLINIGWVCVCALAHRHLNRVLYANSFLLFFSLCFCIVAACFVCFSFQCMFIVIYFRGHFHVFLVSIGMCWLDLNICMLLAARDICLRPCAFEFKPFFHAFVVSSFLFLGAVHTVLFASTIYRQYILFAIQIMYS